MVLNGNILKRLLIGLITLVCILTLGYYVSLAHQNNAKDNQINIKFSKDPSFDEAKLVNESAIIVKGTFAKVKEKTTKKINSKTKEGKSVEVEMQYKVYEFNVSKELKNNASVPNKIDVVVPDVNVDNQPIEFTQGKEYVLYLYKFDKFSNNAYAIIDYDDGILEADKSGAFKSRNKESAPLNVEQIQEFIKQYKK